MSDKLTIITNHKPRDLVTFWDVPESERSIRNGSSLGGTTHEC